MMARTLIDTTAGAGETLKAGGDKINAMTAELYPLAAAGANAAGARRPTVAILGDSYGQYLGAAIQWACARYYPADIDYDGRTPADGGRAFWVGGTSSAYMLATELPNYLANPADIAFVWTSKNSPPGSLATAQSEFANVRQTVDAILSAGASLVVILSFAATGGSATGFAVEALNNYLRAYARANDRIVCLEPGPILLDLAGATTTTQPFRGTNGAYQAASFDGTHPSGYAVRQLAALVAPVLQRIAGRRLPRVTGIRGGAYHPSTSPGANLIGDNGLMLGAVGAGNATGWSVAGTSGGIATATSIVLGGDGFQRQRIAFSGTTTYGGAYAIFQTQPSITSINNGDATRLFDGEAMLDFNAVQGLTGVSLTGPGAPSVDANVATSADRFPDGYTDSGIFLYGLSAYTAAGNSPECRLVFYFAGGQTLSGSVDVYRASWARVAP